MIMNSNDILKKVIDSSESIFNNIAENYPLLLSKLENDIESATESIDQFSTLDDITSEGKNVKLSEYLYKSNSRFREALEMLGSFGRRNDEMLKRLSGSMDGYRHSKKYIDEIRDISESLQIVSLNALCNAVKAGRGGEGFSVITGDLKNVTESTIEKTTALEKKGNEVQSSLDNFIVVERETSSKRKEIFTLLEDKVVNGINAFRAESETIDNLFRQLTTESGSIRQCILRIMEELQQQDLVRQTIDQVMLSIDELPELDEGDKTSEESEKEYIDKLVFSRRLMNLGVVMIEDVEGKILNTIQVFSENFKSARMKLEYIQNEKERAVTTFLQNLKVMTELAEMGNEIQAESLRLATARGGLIDLISNIIRHVEGIVEEFSSFEKISGWLQNVAVLSRIELSRSKQLAGMRESVDDMSELVQRIQQQISEGEKVTLEFISDISQVSDEYKEFAIEEMNFLTEFSKAFLKHISIISSTNNNISSVLSNFDFFSDEFCELLEESEKELDLLKEISENLKSVGEDLKNRESGIVTVLDEKLNGSAIGDWMISDDDMNNIINRFTIYSHKKTAGEAGGFEVEEAVLDEGEITLF